jgi:DNA-binding MarR family transcriptional regulator
MAQEDRFAELLSAVSREVTLRQASDVCCSDFTLEQFQTLRAVTRAEQLTIGALSTQLRVDLSTMSRNVTVLERNGYLLRSRSSEDGRVVFVRITPKGRRALDTLRCDERDLLRDVFERLPAAERPKVVKALEVLQSCLETDTSPTGAACCAPTQIRPTRKGAS